MFQRTSPTQFPLQWGKIMPQCQHNNVGARQDDHGLYHVHRRDGDALKARILKNNVDPIGLGKESGKGQAPSKAEQPGWALTRNIQMTGDLFVHGQWEDGGRHESYSQTHDVQKNGAETI